MWLSVEDIPRAPALGCGMSDPRRVQRGPGLRSGVNSAQTMFRADPAATQSVTLREAKAHARQASPPKRAAAEAVI
jgi:hypothetical protein